MRAEYQIAMLEGVYKAIDNLENELSNKLMLSEYELGKYRAYQFVLDELKLILDLGKEDHDASGK